MNPITPEVEWQIIRSTMIPLLARHLPRIHNRSVWEATAVVFGLYAHGTPRRSRKWDVAFLRCSGSVGEYAALFDFDNAALGVESFSDDFKTERLIQAKDLSAACSSVGVDLSLINPDARILKAVERNRLVFNMNWWHSGDAESPRHPCGTRHCRAGWYTAMHGNVGKRLEDVFGTRWVGAAVFAASYPGRPLPLWYCRDDEALADMRRNAAA